MKLYFAIIDNVGNATTSVSTAEPMEMLKQIFISLPSGEFDLNNPVIADRIKEVNDLWEQKFSDIQTPVEVIDYISRILTSKDRDEEVAEELAEELMIFNLTDDDHNLVAFLSDLREIFNGTSYDLSSMVEDFTHLIVRIEL